MILAVYLLQVSSVLLENILQIFTTNILDIVQSIALIITLIIIYWELRHTRRHNEVAVDLQIATSHRELWMYFLKNPQLHRILEKNVDLGKTPITTAEHLFVNMLFSHIHSVFKADQERIINMPVEWKSDLDFFLEFPIPAKIWGKNKHMYENEFIAFFEFPHKTK